MFSPDHFMWIGISAIIVGVLLFFSRKYKFSYKTATYIMFGIYVASEIAKIFLQFHIIDGQLKFIFNATFLPFQLCTVTIFLVTYLVFAKNEKRIEYVKSLVLEITMIGAPLAMILPTSFVRVDPNILFDSFTEPEIYRFFIYHAGMIWYGLYLLTTKQVKMGFKPWWQSYLGLMFLMLNTIWINALLKDYNTNFMFTVAPPVNGIPLLNLNHGRFVYLLVYASLFAIITFLFQLPAIIKQSKKVSN